MVKSFWSPQRIIGGVKYVALSMGTLSPRVIGPAGETLHDITKHDDSSVARTHVVTRGNEARSRPRTLCSTMRVRLRQHTCTQHTHARARARAHTDA